MLLWPAKLGSLLGGMEKPSWVLWQLQPAMTELQNYRIVQAGRDL